MSFCTVEQLTLVKKQLDTVPAYQRLDEEEKNQLNMAVLDGLEDIERKRAEYNRL